MSFNTDGALELPFQASLGVYGFQCAINNRTYQFDVRWNGRESAWYVDISEQDLTPILMGIKLVLGVYLGRQKDHPLFKEGVLVVVDLSGQQTEAGFDDIGTRVLVEYIPIGELVYRIGQVEGL